ncbi:FBD-associated F-box protein [Cardamine amara subsp. amara]|uniref:FBD-associated F-box protein n=1 Tax=Cardamine amara subsp. amara TaxID=228776 RepID=A0ABD1C986_CARAN
MEERKASEGFSNAREDLISKLHDSLISQILFYLPTKEAVRTSVLSKRWNIVWLLIPRLDLESYEFPTYNEFVVFMDKFLDFSKGENSCLHKLRLSIWEEKNDQYSSVTRWIDFVAATHKLKHLDVESLIVKRECLQVMPVSLYISQTLLYLRLHRVLLGSFESVSLPCLKTMHLETNIYANETSLELLISSCHVLEDLSIVRKVDDNVKVLRVHSQSINSLSVGYVFPESQDLSRFDRVNSGVLIDAPKLKYLKFIKEISASKIISNLCSLVKVGFVGPFHIQRKYFNGNKQMASNFFTGIARVRDMSISYSVMKLILKVESSFHFGNLTCLEAKLYGYDVKILSTFLERCPNLKSIVLDFDYSSFVTAPSFSSVPQCLLSSIEFVEIKSRFNGRPVEIEVAKYFVKNSIVLKKLVVHLSHSMQNKSFVDLTNLFTWPRASSMCEIVHVNDC